MRPQIKILHFHLHISPGGKAVGRVLDICDVNRSGKRQASFRRCRRPGSEHVPIVWRCSGKVVRPAKVKLCCRPCTRISDSTCSQPCRRTFRIGWTRKRSKNYFPKWYMYPSILSDVKERAAVILHPSRPRQGDWPKSSRCIMQLAFGGSKLCILHIFSIQELCFATTL